MVAAALALAIALPICLNSCVSTITPPENPPNPCTAYLLQEAKHVAIVLPDFEGGFVEYGFGDWDWYALIHNRWYHVFDTVLWPTRGCLGRRTHQAASLKKLREKGALHAITVTDTDARALLSSLNQRFNRNRATEIHNTSYHLHFVQDDDSFWFARNCHDAVAEWMEELGCRVSRAPVRLGLAVE